MNEILRAKIIRQLDGLTDEVGRQLLDYLEFLESKYNRSRRSVSSLKRVAETVEEKLGGAELGEMASRGAAQMVEAAGRLMSGLAAASRTVAEELAKPAPPPPVPEATTDADAPTAEAAAPDEEGERSA